MVTEKRILPRSAITSAPLLEGKAEPLVVTGGIIEPLGLGKIPLLEEAPTIGEA